MIEYDFKALQDGIRKINSLRNTLVKPEYKEYVPVKESGGGYVKDNVDLLSECVDQYYQNLKLLVDNTYDYLTRAETLKQIDEKIADSFMKDLYDYPQGKEILEENSQKYKSLEIGR